MKRLHGLVAAACLAAPLAAQTYWHTNAFTDMWATKQASPAAFLFFDGNDRVLERYMWFGQNPRSFTRSSDGTARLRGWVESSVNWKRRFLVDIKLSGYVAPGKTPPSKSPYKNGLRTTAFTTRGGPINTKTWGYYTKMTGTLIGQYDLTGWHIAIGRTGPAFQFGVGANLRNIRLGGSGWAVHRVLRKGSKSWLSNVKYTDYMFNADRDGTNCIASYPFDHNKLESCDEEKCSTAQDLRFGTRIYKSNEEIFLSRNDWYASSRSSSRYPSAYAEIRVDPKSGCEMSHTAVCFDVQRNNGSAIRFVDVRADEDRNSSAGNNFRSVLATLKLPATDKFYRWSSHCIDLSKIKALQGLTKPYSVRLYFYGVPNRGWTRTSTRLDNVLLCGKGDVCKKPTITRISNPTLELVTTNCFRITGTNLNSVTDVRIGNKVITSMNSNDFGNDGYFVKISDTAMCVYPPLCMPGSFRLSVRNKKCGDAYTGSAAVRFVAPSGNRMATTPAQDADATWCAFLYGKNKNNYYCVFASPFNKPSSVKGIIDLGIGDNFKILIAFDAPGPKCWKWCIGTWTPAVKGLRLYFQTLVIDLDNLTKLPFEVTNVTSTRFR